MKLSQDMDGFKKNFALVYADKLKTLKRMKLQYETEFQMRIEDLDNDNK